MIERTVGKGTEVVKHRVQLGWEITAQCGLSAGKVEQGLEQGKAPESECLLKLCPYLILVLTLTWKTVLGDGDGKVELYGKVRALKPCIENPVVFYK